MNIIFKNPDVFRQLVEQFPVFRRVRPLKLGIREDLVAAGFEPVEVSAVLFFLTTSPAYLRAQTAGAKRYDLNGRTAGVVTPQQAYWARKKLRTFDIDEQGAKLAAAALANDPRASGAGMGKDVR